MHTHRREFICEPLHYVHYEVDRLRSLFRFDTYGVVRTPKKDKQQQDV